MSSLTSRQWTAIAAGSLLFAALFFINRKPPAVSSQDAMQSSEHAGNANDFQAVLKESEESIAAPDKQRIDKLVSVLNSSAESERPVLLFQIAKDYDSIGQPLASSYYMEELAKLNNSPSIWCKTGERYLEISEIVQPVDKEPVLTRAENCFRAALKLDSNYQDAKVGVGSCIVERGENPMAGIGMITQVISKDSNNKAAQIALGRFSIKSAQFERAIYRFNRVLQIDSSYHEGYLYLVQAYEGIGNKKEAVINLKKFRNFAPDSAIKVQIDKHISEDLSDDSTNH